MILVKLIIINLLPHSHKMRAYTLQAMCAKISKASKKQQEEVVTILRNNFSCVQKDFNEGTDRSKIDYLWNMATNKGREQAYRVIMPI